MPAGPAQDDAELVEAVRQPAGPRQRRALAKLLTLVESSHPGHRVRADAALDALAPHAGQALRVGVSGVPGVGKSTLIEALGLHLVDRGHRVAVLAVDPSSSVSGGSILGDKTRMERLSMDERAFIRPSPSSGTLGGVADKTREALLVCEAAGHDVVIVETVGVGQSEVAVAGMTDVFVLLLLPNAGDDLQAMKKGVMELADLIVVNKADIDPAAAARAQSQARTALRLLGETTPDSARAKRQVMAVSALTGEGVEAMWQQVAAFGEQQRASGALEARRRDQALRWMWERIHAGLREQFAGHPLVSAELQATTDRVAAGDMAPSAGARRLLARFVEPRP